MQHCAAAVVPALALTTPFHISRFWLFPTFVAKFVQVTLVWVIELQPRLRADTKARRVAPAAGAVWDEAETTASAEPAKAKSSGRGRREFLRREFIGVFLAWVWVVVERVALGSYLQPLD